MSNARLKAAVLISGSGSNLKALIEAVANEQLALDIVRVISNREEAGGLKYARESGIPVSVIPHQQFANRDEHDRAIATALQQSSTQNQGPELIILAGYMRILGADFARLFSHRMINLHPSLLPLYKGLDTYNRAIAAGDQYLGASIHVVTADLDDGPVISQVRIPIEDTDDAASLAAKLGPLEHQLLVATVRQLCNGKLKMQPTACAGSTSDTTKLEFEGAELHQPLKLQADGSLNSTFWSD